MSRVAGSPRRARRATIVGMGQLLLFIVVALVVAAIVFGVTVMVSGGDSGLTPVEPDGRAVPLPSDRPLGEDDLIGTKFDTALRGYRMSQVDQALQRAAYDIGYKGELIGVLEAEVAALREGRIVGYLVCSRYDTVWHVMNVAVDPDLLRRGLGTAMLGALLAEVGDDAARYTLEVRRSNGGAIRLYERFGFKAAGLRRRYYHDNGEDALIMWRTPATLEGRLDDIPAAGPVPTSP